MSEFATTQGEIDASELEQEAEEQLEAQFEGLKFPEGALLTWLIKIFARFAETVFGQAAALEKGAFKRFGEAIVSVPPIQAAPAAVESVWTMVDNAGYTIPAGTQVEIAATGDERIGFETTEEVVVEPGATKATVPLQAIEPGEEGNELTAAPQLVDALTFVESIALEGTTSGGVNEEEEDAYLNRLVETLQLLSLSLIVGRDFEIDARAIAGIARAKCLEAYNAEAGKEEALSVSVYPVDENGEALSAAVKTELKERQQAKVPSGVDVYVADPEYTELDITASVTVLSGFDAASVLEAVKARLGEYLSPAKWGLPQSGDTASGSGWENVTHLYYNEVISTIDQVAGVDRVVSLQIGKHGAELGEVDVELAGAVPLSKPGTFTITEA